MERQDGGVDSPLFGTINPIMFINNDYARWFADWHEWKVVVKPGGTVELKSMCMRDASISSAAPIRFGTWTHVAVIVKDLSWTLVVNGVAQGTSLPARVTAVEVEQKDTYQGALQHWEYSNTTKFQFSFKLSEFNIPYGNQSDVYAIGWHVRTGQKCRVRFIRQTDGAAKELAQENRARGGERKEPVYGYGRVDDANNVAIEWRKGDVFLLRNQCFAHHWYNDENRPRAEEERAHGPGHRSQNRLIVVGATEQADTPIARMKGRVTEVRAWAGQVTPERIKRGMRKRLTARDTPAAPVPVSKRAGATKGGPDRGTPRCTALWADHRTLHWDSGVLLPWMMFGRWAPTVATGAGGSASDLPELESVVTLDGSSTSSTESPVVGLADTRRVVWRLQHVASPSSSDTVASSHDGDAAPEADLTPFAFHLHSAGMNHKTSSSSADPKSFMPEEKVDAAELLGRDGRQLLPNEDGINVAVCTADGVLVNAAAFDFLPPDLADGGVLWSQAPKNHKQFVAMVTKVPDRHLVFAAVRQGHGCEHDSEDVVWRPLGLSEGCRYSKDTSDRSAYVAVAVKGAPPGCSVEMADTRSRFYVDSWALTASVPFVPSASARPASRAPTLPPGQWIARCVGVLPPGASASEVAAVIKAGQHDGEDIHMSIVGLAATLEEAHRHMAVLVAKSHVHSPEPAR